MMVGWGRETIHLPVRVTQKDHHHAVEELTRTEVNDLRDQFAALLHEVDGGGLEASASMRYRIEGVVAALAVVTGDEATMGDLVAPAAPQRR